jgi:hypothetical protein
MIEDEIQGCFTSLAEKDQEEDIGANVVDALFAISRSLDRVARALRDLGNADAATPMGGMEALGDVVHKGMGTIAFSIGSGLTEIAESIGRVEK